MSYSWKRHRVTVVVVQTTTQSKERERETHVGVCQICSWRPRHMVLFYSYPAWTNKAVGILPLSLPQKEPMQYHENSSIHCVNHKLFSVYAKSFSVTR